MSSEAKLSLNSARRIERVELKSSQSFSVPAFGFATVTIPHPLGGRPYFKAWYIFGSRMFPLFAGTGSYNLDGNFAQIDNVNIDSLQLAIEVENNGPSIINGIIYYRIYAEQQI